MFKQTPQTSPPGLPKQLGKKLTVIRHGSTVLNSDGKNRGWVDAPLDQKGKEEAEKLGKQLKGSDIDLLISSDLVRAEQTAKIISNVTGIPYVGSTTALRPLHIGELSGKDIMKTLPMLQDYMRNKPDISLPGGESFSTFQNRAIQGLKEILRKYPRKHIAMVTHHRVERLTDGYLRMGKNNDNVDIEAMMVKGMPPGSATTHDLTAKMKISDLLRK